MVFSASTYFLYKIACIFSKFDTPHLQNTLIIGFCWFMTNIFQSIPTLIVDRYFNNVYYYDFVKENFSFSDNVIGFTTNVICLLSVIMVYGVLTSIEKEDK